MGDFLNLVIFNKNFLDCRDEKKVLYIFHLPRTLLHLTKV